MPPSGVDYASEFLNGYAPEYVNDTNIVVPTIIITVSWNNSLSMEILLGATKMKRMEENINT